MNQSGVTLTLFQSGHMPCVRVWEVDGAKVAETQSHNYGVSHVAFSISSQYIVSVGYQHDMTVSVWDWRVSGHTHSHSVPKLFWFSATLLVRACLERVDHRLQQSVQQSIWHQLLSGQQLLCHSRKQTRQVLVLGCFKRAEGT